MEEAEQKIKNNLEEFGSEIVAKGLELYKKTGLNPTSAIIEALNQGTDQEKRRANVERGRAIIQKHIGGDR
jgi:hypothetical protein